MKTLARVLLCLFFLPLTQSISAFDENLITKESKLYIPHFEEAYQTYTNIPKGLLEAVAFSYTRIQHYDYAADSPESCVGIPRTYGVMGLTLNGKGYFKNNLTYVSVLSGASKEDIMNDPRTNILAYAKAYQSLMTQKDVTKYDFKRHMAVLKTLSELPDITNAQDFALNSQLYAIFWFLTRPEFQEAYNFPNHRIDMVDLFGEENYKVLSSTNVKLSNQEISNETGVLYEKAGPCQDYPTSIWNEADASNYSSRSGTAITAITIHDIEGTYAGAISWFKNPSSNVSSHYVLRSMDGQVTQMVCEADKAWHVAAENPYTVGLEHEGKADEQGWYTEALYQSSADVCRDVCNDYSIDPIRTFDGPATYQINVLGACIKIKGHQHFPNNSHRDPGLNWDWEYFYRLMNEGSTTTPISYTAATGNIYDSGGSGANYSDDERIWYLIEPTGATSVTLTFSAFDIEANWDYLYVYDGTSVHDELIGVYTGTNIPGTIIGESGAILLEFRSDCATTAPGWEASYVSSTAPSACPVPVNLMASNVSPFFATLSWDATSTGIYLLRYRDHLYGNWNYVTTTSTSELLSGLSAGSEYYWGVASLCGSDTSSFSGAFFTTLAPSNVTIDQCEGVFRDAGGPEGVYLNQEDWTYTINATGSITMNFYAFDVEANYDYLYIYDGNSTASPQISGSPFTGTSSPGTIVSSGSSLTFRFTSDNRTNTAGWNAAWTCSSTAPSDNIPPTTAIGNLSNWKTNDFSVAFTDADNSGGSGIQTRLYNIADYDGTEWRSNADNGFFTDQFNTAIHTDWTSQVGTWSINTGALSQTDETQSNTNLYAPLVQQAGKTYLYHWKGQINGSGTNRRAGIHFFCDDASLDQRGNSYMVYWRVDNNTCQIYKATANNIVIQTDDPVVVNANTWYDFKILFNQSTGEIKAFLDDVLVSSWVDSSPLTSGNSISLRGGNCNNVYDDLKVYQSRSTSANVAIGSSSTDVRYQNPNPSTPSASISSIVIDNVDLFSTEVEQTANVDWTAPSDVASINDGNGADIDNSTNTNTIEANWTSSLDSHSDIASYWYAIGTTSGGNDVVSWSDNGNSTTLSHSGLSLSIGTTYYVSVKAENGAGLFSNVITTDGVTIDSPTAAPVANFNETSVTVCAGDMVQFTNTSTNATSYSWTFQNGSPATSSDVNPMVSYASGGTYTVSLTATGPGGTDTYNYNVVVNVEQAPVANATADNTTLTLPSATVNFTNTSANATTYNWDFGDGDLSSATSPSHTYLTSGIYTVTLTASNGVCADDQIDITITVVDPGTTPVASFNNDPITVCSGDAVTFSNSSTDATTYSWTFQNGTPATSSDVNPQVTFPSSGTYSVSLTANGPGGTDQTTQVISVSHVNPPNAAAVPNMYTAYLPNANVVFTNNSANSTSYFWDFGDGGTSTDTHPWHTYSAAGAYQVMLVAENGHCANDTLMIAITVEDATGINDLNSSKFRLYPNPVQDQITIETYTVNSGKGIVNIIDLTGRVIHREVVSFVSGKSVFVLNIKEKEIATGTYWLELILPDNVHINDSFIVE